MVENRPGGIRGILVDITEQKQNAEFSTGLQEVCSGDPPPREEQPPDHLKPAEPQAESLRSGGRGAVHGKRWACRSVAHPDAYTNRTISRAWTSRYESLMVSLMHARTGGVSYQVDVEESGSPSTAILRLAHQ
jgi:hypothetical protein